VRTGVRTAITAQTIVEINTRDTTHHRRAKTKSAKASGITT
jgi:hypothetical protein